MNVACDNFYRALIILDGRNIGLVEAVITPCHQRPITLEHETVKITGGNLCDGVVGPTQSIREIVTDIPPGHDTAQLPGAGGGADL